MDRAEENDKGSFQTYQVGQRLSQNPRNLGLGADKVDIKKSEVRATELTSEDATIEKKNKSKEKKREQKAQGEIISMEPTVKKRLKKNRQENLHFESVENTLESADEIVKKKKKSKKNKRTEEVYETEETVVETEVTKKKKTKKA